MSELFLFGSILTVGLISTALYFYVDSLRFKLSLAEANASFWKQKYSEKMLG